MVAPNPQAERDAAREIAALLWHWCLWFDDLTARMSCSETLEELEEIRQGCLEKSEEWRRVLESGLENEHPWIKKTPVSFR